MRAGRLAVAALLAMGFLAVQVPLHEYVHCAAWWARGGDPVCEVRFAKPGTSLPAHGGLQAGAAGAAMVGGEPWWEHPLMYLGHALAAAVFGLWLGGWLGRREPGG